MVDVGQAQMGLADGGWPHPAPLPGRSYGCWMRGKLRHSFKPEVFQVQIRSVSRVTLCYSCGHTWGDQPRTASLREVTIPWVTWLR